MKDSLKFLWIKDIKFRFNRLPRYTKLEWKFQGHLDPIDRGLTDKRIPTHVAIFYSFACRFRNRINTQPMFKTQRKYDQLFNISWLTLSAMLLGWVAQPRLARSLQGTESENCKIFSIAFISAEVFGKLRWWASKGGRFPGSTFWVFHQDNKDMRQIRIIYHGKQSQCTWNS